MPEKSLVKRTRRPRGTGVEREVTKLSTEQWMLRHQSCINETWLAREHKRALERGTYWPEKVETVCNHPEDGLCGYSITDAQLAEVNSRLGGKAEEPSRSPEEDRPGKIKRPYKKRKESAPPPVTSFYCLKCESRHESTAPEFNTHVKFKRGRGRPSKK